MWGYIILIEGSDHKVCILQWQSNKIKRVVKSTITDEALSLSEATDNAIYINHIFHELFGFQLPIICYVDNKSVVTSIYSSKSVDDKRLRIEIGALKQSLYNGEIHEIHWLPGKNMLADVLTKRGANPLPILDILKNGIIKFTE